MRFRRKGGLLSGWIWNRSCTFCRIDFVEYVDLESIIVLIS